MQGVEAVLYQYYGEYESSTHESEFLYCEEQEGVASQQVQVADYKEEPEGRDHLEDLGIEGRI
jgi:hypothetical protein